MWRSRPHGVRPSWFADYVLPMGVGSERHDIALVRDPCRRAGSGSVSRSCAGMPSCRARTVDAELAGVRLQSGRGLGGERVLARPVMAYRPRRLDGYPPALRQPQDQPPATVMPIDEYYGRMFEEEVPGLRRSRRCRRTDPARVHARPWPRSRCPARSVRARTRKTSIGFGRSEPVASRTIEGVYRKPGTSRRLRRVR